MHRFFRRQALLAAALVLAPAILCATVPRIDPPAGASQSLRGIEGIICFCHKPAAGTEGAIKSPEAPAARILYLPTASAGARPDPAGAVFADASPRPAFRPAPEPLLPPPIRVL